MAEGQRAYTVDLRAFDAAGSDLTARAEFLELSREQLAAQIELLEASSERGCVEYKQQIASAAFRLLGEAKYKSLSTEQLNHVRTEFGILSFVTAMQRMMSLGTIRIRDIKRPDGTEAASAAPEIPIKSIIADVQQRVAADPTVKQQQEIKNILMHLQRYQREAAKLKETASGAQAQVKAAMTKNFSQQAEEIFTSIRKNYRALESDERESLRQEPGNILLRVPIKELAPLFRAQTEVTIGIRSRLARARAQGQGVREAFVESSERESEYLSLLESEFDSFGRLGGTAAVANRMAQAFAEEIRRKIALETEIY
jgi:hypothetical protein